MMRKALSIRRPFTRAFLPLFLTLGLLMGLYSSALTAGVSSASENPPSANTTDNLTNRAFGDVNKQQLAPGTTATRHASPSGSAALPVPALPHQTDFLSAGCFTHTFAGLTSTARANCLHNIKSRGYTHFYLYAYNENGYGGPSFNYYLLPQAFRSYLQEIINQGLAPVVWLVPDDAKVMRQRSAGEVKAMLSQLVPQIDDLVSSYVLGLELDEYWGQAKVDDLGRHLDSLTQKEIGVHLKPGRWDYCQLDWCDYLVLQYGFGQTAPYIQQLTKQALSDLGKPVVAGEYWRKSEGIDGGKHLGDAGVAAGASGYGNGGTVTTAPPMVNQPPVADAGPDITISLSKGVPLN
jgi:hypothetical protein